jgi:hypothetical protein
MNDYSGVITRFIDHCGQRLPLTIYGDGSQTRDFDMNKANKTINSTGKLYCSTKKNQCCLKNKIATAKLINELPVVLLT